MKKKFTIIVCVAYFLFNALQCVAQDPQLSQFYASPVYTNPAFAGTERKIRIVSSMRNQYSALKNNFKTMVMSVDGYSPKFSGGLGLLASYDLAGDGFLKTVSVGGIYSYSLSINREWSVSAAIQGSIVQRTYDVNKLRFGDQLNEMTGYSGLPSEDLKNLNFQGKTYANFASGILVYSSSFYGGLAVHNMLQPNQSFIDNYNSRSQVSLPRRATAHAGFNIYTSKSRHKEDGVILSPNILVMQQADFYQVNLGMYVKNQALTIGTWFRQTSRNADAVIFLVGLKLPVFRIGYSYDVGVSSRTAMGGSHELSLSLHIKQKRRSATRRSKYLACPDL